MTPSPMPAGGTRRLPSGDYEAVLLHPERLVMCIRPTRTLAMRAALALYLRVQE